MKSKTKKRKTKNLATRTGRVSAKRPSRSNAPKEELGPNTKFFILWCPTSMRPPRVQMFTRAEARKAARNMVMRTGHTFFMMESVAVFEPGEPVEKYTGTAAPASQRSITNNPHLMRPGLKPMDVADIDLEDEDDDCPDCDENGIHHDGAARRDGLED